MPIMRESSRTQRTRDAVVRAAVALLLEAGTSALTVEAVVQRSGVARSTIYRHWPTRTEMVAAAFAELMPELVAPEVTGDLSHQLEALLCPLADQIGTEEFAALVPSLLAGAARDPELAPFHAEFVSRQREPVRGVLRRAVEEGALGEVDLDEAVSQLVGPLLFQRVILDESVGPGFARRLIADFLAAHPPGEQRPTGPTA
jgi:AcrR family transcriptional regulator